MKFECQETCGGKCCKIPPKRSLFVFLTGPDRFRLANFLHKPINKFAQRSHFSSTRFKKSGWVWHLKQTTADKCRFLINGKCSVYEARPTQCRTWPFWPENLTEEIQAAIAEECPGIGKGDEVPEEIINTFLEEQRKADAVYTNQKR